MSLGEFCGPNRSSLSLFQGMCDSKLAYWFRFTPVRSHFCSSRDPCTGLGFPFHLPSRQHHRDSSRVSFFVCCVAPVVCRPLIKWGETGCTGSCPLSVVSWRSRAHCASDHCERLSSPCVPSRQVCAQLFGLCCDHRAGSRTHPDLGCPADFCVCSSGRKGCDALLHLSLPVGSTFAPRSEPVCLLGLVFWPPLWVLLTIRLSFKLAPALSRNLAARIV